MGFRPLLTRCWESFLTFKGFTYNRTKGSHDQWVKPGFRSIPVRGDEKDVPPLHLKTGCRSIGCTMDDLYAWAEINC